jgi:hypothetical protein
VLKLAGRGSDRGEGTRRIKRLIETGVAAVRDQLDTFWRRTLSGFEGMMKADE